MEPYSIFTLHPQQWPIMTRTIIQKSGTLPWNTTNRCSVNRVVQVLVVGEGQRLIVACQRCSPQLKEDIGVASRHLLTTVKEICKFKCDAIFVRRPIV